MKKQLQTLLLMLIVAGFGNAYAGTVNISVFDSSLTFCPPPATNSIFINGTTTGYNNGVDSVRIDAYWGDGNDSTFYLQIDNGGNYYNNNFIEHTYLFSGFFTTKYVVTGPDNAKDSVITPNDVIVADTCGNITGKVYFDANSDCVFNTGDTEIKYGTVNLLLNSNVIATTYTNQNGNYSFSVPTSNTYDVEIDLNTTGFSSICPSNGKYTISSFPAYNQDFALDCPGSYDLTGSVGGGSVPGQLTPLYVSWTNLQCQPINGTAMLILSDPLISYVSSNYNPPTKISGDTLFWDYTNLGAITNLSDYSSIKITTDTTAQIGDTICVQLIVEPISGDANPNNNIVDVCIPVTTSYDPNNKQAIPLGAGSEGKIDPNQTMTYVLNFQNTGTAQAYNIFILDSIDVSVLDISSIRILGQSHSMEFSVLDDNVVKFRFDNILLPDSASDPEGSKGFVSFSIDQQPNLPHATEIKNKVGIYFDYNEPVITNTALNTIWITTSSIKEEVVTQWANFYPNPAKDRLTIELQNSLEQASIKLFDISGKMLLNQKVTGKQTINTNQFNNGVYSIMLTSGDNVQVTKLIISK